MTRKKFIKRLMGMGISRNTATAAADAASRAELPLLKVAGRVQIMQLVFASDANHYKQYMQAFDSALLYQAKRIPARIKPLRTKRTDGLRAQFVMVDEMAALPPADRQRVLVGRWVGIDLANGPDLTAGGGGHE